MINNLTWQQLYSFFKRGLLFILRIMLSYIATLPVLLILLLLRPFILIRVGELRTDAIGHLAMNQELYLCELDKGLHPPQAFDIFFFSSCSVVNYQLIKMWSDRLRINRFAYYVYKAVNFYPGFKRHFFNTNSRDKYGILNDSKPHLSFTQDDIELGEADLLNMDIRGKDYICILARDEAYKKAIEPEIDRSYHSYNNVDVNTYVPAIEKLANRGYHVLRMGSVVGKKIKSSHPRIIDYATNGKRTDFLDIYISANCRFFISNGSGLDNVPKIFGRPILYVNSIPLEYVHAERHCYLEIFKKLWMRDEHRFMTFREILESGVGRFLTTAQYEKCNLEIVDNTPEEIEAAALEMDDRLKGTWHTTEEDDELQRQFWSLFKQSEINRVFLSRIGAEFLRQNRELLPMSER